MEGTKVIDMKEFLEKKIEGFISEYRLGGITKFKALDNYLGSLNHIDFYSSEKLLKKYEAAIMEKCYSLRKN